VGQPAHPSITVNHWILKAKVVQAMREGAAYVNVHSTRSPGGEIRGPVMALRGIYQSGFATRSMWLGHAR
jgi:hypothetical protein